MFFRYSAAGVPPVSGVADGWYYRWARIHLPTIVQRWKVQLRLFKWRQQCHDQGRWSMSLAPTNGQHHLRWQELPLPSGLQPWRRSCCRNEKVKLEQTDKQTTNSPRILNPQWTVTSNGDLMPWIGRNVPVATKSSTRRCPGLILSPVLLLLLVAVVSDKLWALCTGHIIW